MRNISEASTLSKRDPLQFSQVSIFVMSFLQCHYYNVISSYKRSTFKRALSFSVESRHRSGIRYAPQEGKPHKVAMPNKTELGNHGHKKNRASQYCLM